MKKLLPLVLCSALTLSAFSTGFTLNDNSEKKPITDHSVIVTDTDSIDYSKNPVTAKGIELIVQMDKSAESEAYRQLMSGSDKLDEILDNIAKGEYSTPNAVYKVAVTESVALKAFSDLTSLEPLPEEIRSSVERKLTAAIPMHINSTEGVDMVAASSVLTASDSVILDNIDCNQIYVFVYDGITAMVTYIPYEDNIVGVTATFVKLDNIESSEDLNKTFKEELGMDIVFEKTK